MKNTETTILRALRVFVVRADFRRPGRFGMIPRGENQRCGRVGGRIDRNGLARPLERGGCRSRHPAQGAGGRRTPRLRSQRHGEKPADAADAAPAGDRTGHFASALLGRKLSKGVERLVKSNSGRAPVVNALGFVPRLSIPSVQIDNKAAAMEAMDHLYRL